MTEFGSDAAPDINPTWTVVPAAPATPPASPRRGGGQALGSLTLVNGVLTGVGSVYVGKRSVLATGRPIGR